MSKIRKTARFTLWSASLALLSLLTAGALRAQEIRPIAEPNQSVKMGRGGYVCEGQLTHTSIDATENWTYEMVQCTGPIYNANDYVALNAKLSHDELVNVTMTRVPFILSSKGNDSFKNLFSQVEAFFNPLPGRNTGSCPSSSAFGL